MFAGGIAVRKTDGKCDPTHARLPADPVFATPPPPAPFPLPPARSPSPEGQREAQRQASRARNARSGFCPGPRWEAPPPALAARRGTLCDPPGRRRLSLGQSVFVRPSAFTCLSTCGYYLCPPLCPSFPPRSPTNPRCLPRFLIDLAFVAPSPRAVAPPLTIAPQLLPRLLFHLSRMGIGYWGEHCQISSTLFKLRLSRHIRSELSYRHERSADTLYHSSASARTLCCSAALLQRKDRQRRRA